MPLKLTIIRQPEDEPLAASGAVGVRVFDRCGGVLGRDPETDWVLPHKYVSRWHAEIRYEDGRYYVLDRSQNGVYVNGQLVGQGNSALLTDGDRLAIGDYEILAQTELAMAPSLAPPVQPAAGYDPGRSLGFEPVLPSSPSALTATPGGAGLGGIALGGEPDWLGLGPAVPATPTQGDTLPAINEAYRPPTAAPEIPGEIPENWWEEPPTPPGPASVPPGAQSQALPAMPPAGPPLSFAGLGQGATGFAPVPPFPASGAAPGAARMGGGLEAFYAGLGLPGAASPASEAELLALAGALLREFVRGTMELLLARASIKHEARLDVTTLRATENNPLKFAASTDEALQRLLSPQPGAGFLGPREAVREAMQDLRAHELATLAGLEAAVRSMFERFDPARLERDFSERSLLASIVPAHRKAKCWDLFEEQFRQIGEEAREDFNALFGREFARAYQEQVERLRSAGPR